MPNIRIEIIELLSWKKQGISNDSTRRKELEDIQRIERVFIFELGFIILNYSSQIYYIL